MEIYFTYKSILVALLLIGSFSIFAVRIYHLVRLMKAVEGPPPAIQGRIIQRVAAFFIQILFQFKVRQKRYPGLAHTLIFFGFLAIQPHTIETMLEGIFHGFSFAKTAPGAYSMYMFVAEILAFTTLIGLGYCFYRRIFLKPKYLTNAFGARFILVLIAIIILSFFSINTFRLAINSDNLMDFSRYYAISKHISSLLHVNSLSEQNLIFGLEASFWAHFLVIIGFLIYIPASKHLHMLAAIPNVLIGPLELKNNMMKTDLNDDRAGSFGVGSINDLNWQGVLNLYSCTECGRCEEQCPADATGKPLSPKAVIEDLKHELFNQSAQILHQTNGKQPIEPIIRNNAPITEDVIGSCTSCKACESICPVNIQHLDFILEMRKNRVLGEAKFHDRVLSVFRNIEKFNNPYGLGQLMRGVWSTGLPVQFLKEKGESEYLLYVGCLACYDPLNQQTAANLVDIFSECGLDFAVLGDEELCCGDPARRLGNEALYQQLVERNINIFKRYNAKKIITLCPHCYNTFKNEYSEFGVKWEVYHYLELLESLRSQNRIKFERKMDMTVGYHDSCYLGRYNKVYSQPRKLIESLPGASLVELKNNQEKSFCCGGGGGIFWTNELGERISHHRMRQATSTSIDCLTTACPFCLSMLQDASTETGGETPVPVEDLSGLIKKAMGLY